MPWCEACTKYFVPGALAIDGSCPKCGEIVAQTDINGKLMTPAVTAKTLNLKALARSGGEDEKIPWHFKLLVGLLIIYLSWRFVSIFI